MMGEAGPAGKNSHALEREYEEGVKSIEREVLLLQQQFVDDIRALDRRLTEGAMERSAYVGAVEEKTENFLHTVDGWLESFQKFIEKIPDAEMKRQNIKNQMVEWVNEQIENII